MTQEKKEITNNKINNEKGSEINLEEELQNLQEEESKKGQQDDQKDTSGNKKSEEDLQKEIELLQKKLAEQEEITKKAQHTYIDLKMDFERLVRQTQEKEKTMKADSTIEVVKKLLPFVENLRKSLAVIKTSKDENLQENSVIKGLHLMYDNFLKTLEELGVFAIDAIGLDPDTNLHAPVGMQATEDKNLKGKIIEEFEKGFIFKKDSIEKVIIPTKVIIGQ